MFAAATGVNSGVDWTIKPGAAKIPICALSEDSKANAEQARSNMPSVTVSDSTKQVSKCTPQRICA